MRVDLRVAFNGAEKLEDPRTHRVDKNNKRYTRDEYVESEERPGAARGVVHAAAAESIFKTNTLDIDYATAAAEANLPAESLMFGAGIFKKDFGFDFRNKSSTLNNHSIKINQRFLLMMYFDPREVESSVNDFDRHFAIRRTLPSKISQILCQTLLEQLPRVNPTQVLTYTQTPDMHPANLESISEMEWKADHKVPLTIHYRLIMNLMIAIVRGDRFDFAPVASDSFEFLRVMIKEIKKNLDEMKVSHEHRAAYLNTSLMPYYPDLSVLKLAIVKDNLAVTKLLLEEGFSFTLPDTPLQLAVKFGCWNVAKHFLDEETNLTTKGIAIHKLLLTSVELNNLELFEKVLTLSPDTKFSFICIFHFLKRLQTPERFEMFFKVLKGMDDKQKKEALKEVDFSEIFILTAPHPELQRMLYEVHMKQEEYRALNNAIVYGHLEALQKLLENKVDSNMIFSNGECPLSDLLLCGGDIEINKLGSLVNVLLEYGANPLQVVNERTPLTLAIEKSIATSDWLVVSMMLLHMGPGEFIKLKPSDREKIISNKDNIFQEMIVRLKSHPQEQKHLEKIYKGQNVFGEIFLKSYESKTLYAPVNIYIEELKSFFPEVKPSSVDEAKVENTVRPKT